MRPAALPVRSAVAGMRLPPVPDARGESLLAMLWQLARTERLPPEALDSLARRQLAHSLEYAWRETPSLREHWLASGAAGAPGPESLGALPILAAPGPPAERHAGSGAPPATADAPQPAAGWSRFLGRALRARAALWHGLDWSGAWAAALPAPARAGAAALHAAFDAVFACGPYLECEDGLDGAALRAWLERAQPCCLFVGRAQCEALAAAAPGAPAGAAAAGSSLPALWAWDWIPTDEERRDVRRRLGVPLITEVCVAGCGPSAVPCPEHGALHVQAEAVWVEIVDRDGRPVPAGGSGRLVLSALHDARFRDDEAALPPLRLDSGLWARQGGACECGRTLPVIELLAPPGEEAGA
jgi:hypothetical protein